MYIKVHFGDKPLFLTDSITNEIEQYIHHDDTVFMDEFSAPGINTVIHEMKQGKVHAGILYHGEIEKLKKAFWKKFTIVKAAGGLVVNDDGAILMIFRRDRWDLPKGKLDPGESLEECAAREITEETGLKKIILEKFLLTTFHTYDENGKHILKETSWYLFHQPGEQELHPEAGEQITKIEWVRPDQLSKYVKNTYPSIVDVLQAAGYV